MKKYTEIKPFRFTKEQSDSMAELKKHDVNIQQFVRDAYVEKFKRDWKKITSPKIKFIGDDMF